MSSNDFTCAVLNDGSLKCFGTNNQGQLGTGSYLPPAGNLPATADLGTGRTATDISLGSEHACAALDDGTIKCWGQNDKGQVGTGSPGSFGITLPTLVSFDGSSSSGSSGSSPGGSGRERTPRSTRTDRKLVGLVRVRERHVRLPRGTARAGGSTRPGVPRPGLQHNLGRRRRRHVPRQHPRDRRAIHLRVFPDAVNDE